jgi:hypothetical protein
MIYDVPDLIRNIRGLTVNRGAMLAAFIVIGIYMQMVSESDAGAMYGCIAYGIYISLSMIRTCCHLTKFAGMAIRDMNRKSSTIVPCENMKLILLRQAEADLFNQMGEIMQTLIEYYNIYTSYEDESEEKTKLAEEIEVLLDVFTNLNTRHNIIQILIDNERQ